MRTTLHVDDRLFAELLEVTQAKTKTEAVHRALTEYLRMARKQRLLALRGKLDLTDNWQALRDLEAAENAEAPDVGRDC